MSVSPLVEAKAKLRAEVLERRAAMEPGLRATAAAAVADRLTRHFRLPEGGVVSGYWPLEGELDPRPALQRLADAGHPLALPRMYGRQEPLVFHLWRPADPLLPGGFKVMEPDPSRPVVRPDMVLAPLLAFDRAGRRLGYGRGYYDRTLAGLRRDKPAVLVIGLAFAVQQVPKVPADVTDERLDAVITDAGLHVCSSRGEAACLVPEPGA